MYPHTHIAYMASVPCRSGHRLDRPDLADQIMDWISLRTNAFTSSNAAELASKVYKYYFNKNKKSRKSLLNQKVSNPAFGSSPQTD